MSDKTDLVGLGAIALVGYLLIKKITDLGTSAANTATTYIEKTTEKVTASVHVATDTVKSYVPGTSTDSDKAYDEYKQTVQDINKGVAAVSGVDSPTSQYLYNAGGGYTDLKTGAFIPGAVTNPALDDSSFKERYTGSSGSSKTTTSKQSDYVKEQLAGGTGAPYVQPTATAIKAAVKEYNIITGEKRSSGSSGSSSASTKAPSSVKVGSGYSVATESGTTVNKGKYETIKVRK